MARFKVIQLCYDFEDKPPYFDEGSWTHATREKAEISMLRSVIDELACLNGIMEDGNFPERSFIATMEDEEYDVVVNAWDGPDYRPVTCYKVLSVTDLLRFFNAKLRNKYGQKITVKLHSYEEDDGSIWFYYTSAKYGDSDAYPTASEAYHEADDYLRGVGELW